MLHPPDSARGLCNRTLKLGIVTVTLPLQRVIDTRTLIRARRGDVRGQCQGELDRYRCQIEKKSTAKGMKDHWNLDKTDS